MPVNRPRISGQNARVLHTCLSVGITMTRLTNEAESHSRFVLFIMGQIGQEHIVPEIHRANYLHQSIYNIIFIW